jgi:hypothetical protein
VRRGDEVPILRYAAIVITAALLASQLSSQQNAVFSTTANVVVVNVTVTGRDGKAIGNLTKDDFLLYEDGKLQTLQSCELQKLDNTPLEPIPVEQAKTLQTRESPKPPAGPVPKAPAPKAEDLQRSPADRDAIRFLVDAASGADPLHGLRHQVPKYPHDQQRHGFDHGLRNRS